MSKILGKIISLRFLNSLIENIIHKIEYHTLQKSDLFDSAWYLKCNVDVKQTEVDPVRHYLAHGGLERREPSQLFDTEYYLSQLDQLPIHQQVCENPLLHYLTIGKAAGLVCKEIDDVSHEQFSANDYGLLQQSDLFDAAWYLRCNEDVKQTEVDPVRHYLVHGGLERRDPSQLFDTEYYLPQLNRLPQHQQDCSNPLLHYLKVGKAAGLACALPFSVRWDFPKKNKQLIFIAKRQDGLGERLRAIVNAIALSKRYSAEFKFFWDDVRCNQPDHAIDEKTKIFSAQFIEKHHVNLADIKDALSVSRFFERRNGNSTYFCDQVVPRKFFDDIDYLKFQEELSDAFEYIDFVEPIKKVFEAANNVKLNGDTVALHLRAGDVIYGEHKECLAWLKKAIPFPVALKLVGEISVSGKEVMIFGQDVELMNFLSTKDNVSLSFDVTPDGLGRVESAFFDIALMRRCSSIFAGTSGFALLSALIGNIEFIRHDVWYSSKQLTNIIISQLTNAAILERVSVQQKSYACKVAYFFGRFDLHDRDCKKLFLFGKENDPDDVFFDFIEFWHFLEKGSIEQAALIAEHIVSDKRKSFERFVKKNVYGATTFLKLFDLNKLENVSENAASLTAIYHILMPIKLKLSQRILSDLS